MYSVLLTIHILVTVFLIGIILVQRSASDGMGLSGSSSTSFLSGRSAANAVTRTTAVLAALFIFTSLGLGIITTHSHSSQTSIMDRISGIKPAVSAPASPAPAAVQAPAKPSVPHPQ
jgi:preprotein translocase subunit SecG